MSTEKTGDKHLDEALALLTGNEHKNPQRRVFTADELDECAHVNELRNCTPNLKSTRMLRQAARQSRVLAALREELEAAKAYRHQPLARLDERLAQLDRLEALHGLKEQK